MGRGNHLGESGLALRIAQLALLSGPGTGRAHKDYWYARVGGEKALTVHCLGCYHQAVKRFEELKLWKRHTLVNVPRAPFGSSVVNAEAGI